MYKLINHSVLENCTDLSLFEWIGLKHFFLTVGQNNFGNKIPFIILSKSLLRNGRGQFRMWIASQDYHSTLIHFDFFQGGTLLLKWQLFIIDQTCFSSWFLHDLYLSFWDKAMLVAWLLRTPARTLSIS